MVILAILLFLFHRWNAGYAINNTMSSSILTDYVARNNTIEIAIPTFTLTLVISVNNWIVFQQRILGSDSFRGNIVSFARPWFEYKAGFGNVTDGSNGSGFWLGLERIYQLMKGGSYMLRMEACIYGVWKSAEYEIVDLGSEDTQYRMQVTQSYYGNLGDVFYYQRVAYFYTQDRDTNHGDATSQQSGLWASKDTSLTPLTNFNGQSVIGNTYLFLGPVWRGWGCTIARMMLKQINWWFCSIRERTSIDEVRLCVFIKHSME